MTGIRWVWLFLDTPRADADRVVAVLVGGDGMDPVADPRRRRRVRDAAPAAR